MWFFLNETKTVGIKSSIECKASEKHWMFEIEQLQDRYKEPVIKRETDLGFKSWAIDTTKSIKKFILNLSIRAKTLKRWKEWVSKSLIHRLKDKIKQL